MRVQEVRQHAQNLLPVQPAAPWPDDVVRQGCRLLASACRRLGLRYQVRALTQSARCEQSARLSAPNPCPTKRPPRSSPESNMPCSFATRACRRKGAVEAGIEFEEARRERGAARPTRVAAVLAKAQQRAWGPSASSSNKLATSSPRQSRRCSMPQTKRGAPSRVWHVAGRGRRNGEPIGRG